MHYRLICFDLDGTLVETAPEILDAVNDTLEQFDLPGVEQSLIAGHLMSGEQAAQQADDDLEVLHRHVVVERQLRGDEIARVRGFLVQAHQQQRVQRIHRRHQQRVRIPVVRLPAQRLECVVALRVSHVTLPRMPGLLAHARRQARGLGIVHRLRIHRGRRRDIAARCLRQRQGRCRRQHRQERGKPARAKDAGPHCTGLSRFMTS